jgi:hypothetical protein
MEIFNESYENKKQIEDQLFRKWESALNVDGGIADEHMARTTAILLENYMGHLKSDPSLIAEDRISTSNFSGVNLALLGLIRRAMPSLVGTDLIGIQAMPTPQSPIFYMSWRKSLSDANTSPKGASSDGEEFFGYPGTASDPLGQADPYFTSSQIRNQLVKATPASSTSYKIQTAWAPIINKSVKFFVLDASGNVVGSGHVNENTPSAGATSSIAGTGQIASVQLHTSGSHTLVNTATVTATYAAPVLQVTTGVISTGVKVVVAHEYNQESNSVSPEVTINIQEYTLKLIRRMLRGKFSLDSITDAKAYHGISIENELMEIMKFELMNEINREIVTDLRSMAAISSTADYTAAVANNTVGNYQDSFLFVLDKINGICAEILNQSRRGRGNWVVGNPATLASLDRVPGFIGAGVSYDGKGLSYAGQLNKRINFYVDPQYPKNELLIGYKGASALDCGYIHAPYLPITATPTLYNQETGDPSKLFYTRYSKTYRDIDTDTGLPFQAIYRGEFTYGRLFMNNFPII